MTLTAQDMTEIRRDFPILQTTVRGKPLVYFDNAATTQKPRACIDAIKKYYEHENANVHRGVHYLSEIATQHYEDARQLLARFIHAPSPNNIVFTRGTTEAINLIAHGFAEAILQPEDEIIISAMEHHANIIPWQIACQKTGAKLRIVDLHDDTSLNIGHLTSLLSDKTKLIALCYISNTLGNINPIKSVIDLAHIRAIPVLVDAAQSVGHIPTDVQQLDCDFFVFSAHKMYGPTGVGALYATSHWLNKLPPYQGGGDMILRVTFDSATYQQPPHKFEAGTPPIAEVIAWAASIQYLQQLGIEKIQAYEQSLSDELHHQLKLLTFIQLIGTTPTKTSIVSFTHKTAHPHDMATILDDHGIAIRAGHHCTMPLMNYLHVNATARASLCFYNTVEEIETLVRALKMIEALFS
ncbi:MAG: cysteine desulfurase [Gammaproteobacteria bacterium]|nr:cysteine desulfurase [Gammaproteobacteria bacterium]MCD8543207.1 cysteine desulfurase [Gammaproteobacteria bacterium]